MAKVKDCPGFETFGADVKEARKAKNLARKDLAEKVNIDTRYLANIENEGTMHCWPFQWNRNNSGGMNLNKFL